MPGGAGWYPQLKVVNSPLFLQLNRKFLLEERPEWHISTTASHWAICLMTAEGDMWVTGLEVTPIHQA